MSDKKERTPAEHWDSVAVDTILKQLAPNGFKKIQGGKREVVAMDFMPKKRVQSAAVITANMVRLFRENLREYLNAEIKYFDSKLSENDKAIKATRFYEFRFRYQLKTNANILQAKKAAIEAVLSQLDTIKPSNPKGK